MTNVKELEKEVAELKVEVSELKDQLAKVKKTVSFWYEVEDGNSFSVQFTIDGKAKDLTELQLTDVEIWDYMKDAVELHFDPVTVKQDALSNIIVKSVYVTNELDLDENNCPKIIYQFEAK